MIPIEKLVAPVRDDAPCGDDPAMTGVLFELETLILGKPETQFSAAEEPDWKALKERTVEVAETTKDLRVAGILAATLLRTHGLAGFKEGITLIRRLLEDYWPTVFPLLDATENDDPAERVNALANLSAPMAADGDTWRIIAALRKTPLVSAPRAGRFGLEHYLAVRGVVPWTGEAAAAPSEALLDAAIKEVDPAALAATADCANTLWDDLTNIEKIFKEKSGPSQFPSFELLKKEIKQIVNWLGAAAPASAPAEQGGAASAATEAGAGPVGSGASVSLGASFSGAVRSREDVIRALDAIIAYYQAVEPSSPVPFLLGRTKRIVTMNFMQLITELTPEALDRILLLTGPVNTDSSSSS